jgi:hypothetical protein
MNKKALLRFNVSSNGVGNTWRVIFCDEDCVERLYRDVVIMCRSYTSKDFLGVHGVKFHITIQYTTYEVTSSNVIVFK